jgi:hypothetical protein
VELAGDEGGGLCGRESVAEDWQAVRTPIDNAAPARITGRDHLMTPSSWRRRSSASQSLRRLSIGSREKLDADTDGER